MVGPGAIVHLQLHMSVGDHYRYDRWALDQFGYPLPNGRMEELWTVKAVGATVQGQNGVTVLNDSGVGTPDGTRYIRFAPTGEVYEFGFLDILLRQMGTGSVTQHWDQLLPAQLQSGTTWVVGVADSLGQDIVYGSFTIVPEYFSAQLNGVSNVFPSYRIDLQSTYVQYTFWITDSPTCIPGFQEGSTGFGDGFEAFLSRATVSGHGGP